MMKLYYAYLGVAGGYLLFLIGGQTAHWLAFAAAFGLTALGALALRRLSRWYALAAGAAVIGIALRVAGIWLSGRALTVLEIAAFCALSACLLLAMLAQRRVYGESAAQEYVLFVLLAGYGVSGAYRLFAPSAAGWAADVEHISRVLYLIGMILAVFRAQRLALANEDGQ